MRGITGRALLLRSILPQPMAVIEQPASSHYVPVPPISWGRTYEFCCTAFSSDQFCQLPPPFCVFIQFLQRDGTLIQR